MRIAGMIFFLSCPSVCPLSHSHGMGRDKLSVTFFPLHEHSKQLPLARILDETAEKEVGHSHAEGDANDGQRGFDGIVHTHRDFTDDTVHLDESEEGAIHQHTRNHRDDTRDGDTLDGAHETSGAP